MTKIELERNLGNVFGEIRLEIAANRKHLPMSFETYQTMESFMNSERFDLANFKYLTERLCIECEMSKVKSCVRFLESNYDYDTFKLQIEGCRKYLESVKEPIKQRYQECKNIEKENKGIRDKIDRIIVIENTIINADMFDNESIKNILDAFDELGLSAEVKLKIIALIVERNALFMSENPKKEEKPIHVRAKRIVVVDEEFENNKNAVYEIANQQIGEINDLAIANELVKKAGFTFEARLDVYNAVFVEDSKDDIEQKISFIIYDLANNILPAYEKGKIGKKNSKVLFENIAKLYHKELENLNNAHKKEEEAKEVKNLFSEIEETIAKAKTRLFTKNDIYGEQYEDVFNKLIDLENAYSTSGGMSLDKISNLAHLLQDLKSSMSKTEEVIPSQHIEHPINLFIVANEEELEEDFDELEKAGFDKRGAFLEYIKDHKNKSFNTLDDYLGKTDRSNRLKKKFHIRFHDSKQMQVYYTRCNTTISELSQLFPEYSGVKEVIIVHKIGPGRANTTVVGQSVDDAYKRCDKHETELDEIMNAFSTNWSEASTAERQEAIKIITKVIGEQSVILEGIKAKRKGGASNVN